MLPPRQAPKSTGVSAANLATGFRFLRRLPGHLRRPITEQEARAALSHRLATRQAALLNLLKERVFAVPESPYRRLLAHAGYTLPDLEALLQTNGVERTLQDLLRDGVYISIDEWKGRKEIIRGSLRFQATTSDFLNPHAHRDVSATTGGSRSSGTLLLFDLDFIRACAGETLLYLSAWQTAPMAKAIWEVPGGGARFRLIKMALFGQPPAQWFSQVDPHRSSAGFLHQWSTTAMRIAGRLSRVPLPRPTYIPPTDVRRVAEWMAAERKSGRIPHILTYPSSALAACLAARENGLDIRGSCFTLGGEPITAARLQLIRSTGAEAWPRYGAMECGPIGYGCMCPEHHDEVHVLADLHALIQVGTAAAPHGFPERALMVSSLHPRAPFTMLNTSMGDCATFSSRSCGCPLETLGWTTHLHTIRSYEKYTAAGMTFDAADIIRILDEALPQQFGGRPMDYQLIEEEDDEGRPELCLRIHPRIGPLNEAQVTRALLDALGQPSRFHQMMKQVWLDQVAVRVERSEPCPTPGGKILHLHASKVPPAGGRT